VAHDANGDWGEHYGDRSGADFAIAYKLGFYSGDQEQVRRIMTASGLYRNKWETRRPGGALLTFTVGNAFDKLKIPRTRPPATCV
jgi:primase-polymerase (primpol)-like protein